LEQVEPAGFTAGQVTMRSLLHHRLLMLPMLWLSGCAYSNRQSGLDPMSGTTQMSDDLYQLILWVDVIMAVAVTLGLAYALWRFRYRGETERPVQTHGHLLMEIGWTIAPIVILVAIMVPTVKTIFAQQAPPAHDALKIKVIAKQWWWEYEFEDSGVVVGNELHIPVGKPVYLDMVSHDVIHAWWVPKLTGKRDVNSWQRTQLAFTADEVGTYYGQCTEFCGDSHSLMRIKVIVDTPEDFAKWLAAQKAGVVAQPSDEVRQALAQCQTCHSIRGLNGPDGKPQVGIRRTLQVGREGAQSGPDLTHVGGRSSLFADVRPNTKESLVDWLNSPRSVKAGARMPGAAAAYLTRVRPPRQEDGSRDGEYKNRVHGIEWIHPETKKTQLHLPGDLVEQVADYLLQLK
jgi:cytochrome c oxidase subunit II